MKIRHMGVFVFVLFLFSSASLQAYDSPGPKAPIPPHSSPWIETRQPDVHTVLLWKFSTDEDAERETEALLEKEDLSALLEEKDTESDLSGTAEHSKPELSGGAAIRSGVGRFGGGLVLDGTGHAAANVSFQSLFYTDGGLTLHMWFKCQDKAADGTIVSFCRGGARPDLSIAVNEKPAVCLLAEGSTRADVPLRATRDGWHHLAFAVEVERGNPETAVFSLTVDGATTKISAQKEEDGGWMRKRVRQPSEWPTRLVIGGDGQGKGFRGVVDEVELSRGIRYLYPWSLGWQERQSGDRPVEIKPPFFAGDNVLCRLSFDGSLHAEPNNGISIIGTADATLFHTGLCGMALDLSKADKSGVAICGWGLVPDPPTTVEFWFRPMDWNNYYLSDYHGTDIGFYHLLALRRETSSGQGLLVRDIEVYKGRAGRHAELRWTKFHPGTWTHVLLVFDGGGQRVYLNGRRQAFWQAGCVTRVEPAAQQALKDWRDQTGGKDDGKWIWQFVPSPTLLDEYSVYSWAMTDEEAWNAYARWLPDAADQMKSLPAVRAVFDYWAHSWDLTEKLVIKLSFLSTPKSRVTGADVAIVSSNDTVVFSTEKQTLDAAGNLAITVAKPFDFGSYNVIVKTRDQGGAVLEGHTLTYTRARPVWFENTLGKERTVPKPWTPIVLDGRTFSILGRKIVIGDSGLPERIETAGIPVLAEPVTMRAGNHALKGLGVKVTCAEPDSAEWAATAEGGGLKVDIQGRLEFDGLITFSITLAPGSGSEIRLEDLNIDVPLKQEAAQQFLANGGGHDFRSSWIAAYVPQGSGVVWDSLQKPYPHFCRAPGVSNFMPHIWVGADEIGMYFGAQNDKGWTIDGPKPAQELVRHDDAVVFRMNVIREATTIGAEGRAFGFVMLPTPAKPEPPDWRRQMAIGGVRFGSCDSFGGFDMKTDPSEPEDGDSFRLEPKSWEHAEKMAKEGRAKWGRSILYADASWPRPGDSFADWNHDLWAGTGRIAWTPEFQDYAVWAVNEFLRRGLIDGIYWDDVSVGCTLSLRAGAYEVEGGGRRVGFTALAQRQVNMRLWRLLEAAGKEPCIWAHMTVCYEVPIFSFCRYLSNGEFPPLAVFSKSDAMDFWSCDTLRLLGTGTKWGAGVSFLSTLPRMIPETPQGRQWGYPQCRTETALFISSDIYTIADGLGARLADEGFFDEPPQRVWPWWKADQALNITGPTGQVIRAIVYGFRDCAYVLVANTDRKEHELNVELKRSVLGDADVKWRDLDPGLKPPASAMASDGEIQKAGEHMTELTGGKTDLEERSIEDLLDGVTPEERAFARLQLRTEGSKAQVLVRARDYRILRAARAR